MVLVVSVGGADASEHAEWSCPIVRQRPPDVCRSAPCDSLILSVATTILAESNSDSAPYPTNARPVDAFVEPLEGSLQEEDAADKEIHAESVIADREDHGDRRVGVVPLRRCDAIRYEIQTHEASGTFTRPKARKRTRIRANKRQRIKAREARDIKAIAAVALDGCSPPTVATLSPRNDALDGKDNDDDDIWPEFFRPQAPRD